MGGKIKQLFHLHGISFLPWFFRRVRLEKLWYVCSINRVEKREFLSQLVDNVQIYEERQENGQWLKSIEFKLPIIEKEFTLSLDNDSQNETVVLMSRK